jgi:hypothetical protein
MNIWQVLRKHGLYFAAAWACWRKWGGRMAARHSSGLDGKPDEPLTKAEECVS